MSHVNRVAHCFHDTYPFRDCAASERFFRQEPPGTHDRGRAPLLLGTSGAALPTLLSAVVSPPFIHGEILALPMIEGAKPNLAALACFLVAVSATAT